MHARDNGSWEEMAPGPARLCIAPRLPADLGPGCSVGQPGWQGRLWMKQAHEQVAQKSQQSAAIRQERVAKKTRKASRRRGFRTVQVRERGRLWEGQGAGVRGPTAAAPAFLLPYPWEYPAGALTFPKLWGSARARGGLCLSTLPGRLVTLGWSQAFGTSPLLPYGLESLGKSFPLGRE